MVLECVPEEVAQEVSSLSCFEQTFFLRLFQGRNRILKSGFRIYKKKKKSTIYHLDLKKINKSIFNEQRY